MNITIKELPDYEVAFIRRIGSYFEPPEHWGKLQNWAFDNGLFPPEQSFIGISLDNPELVESNKCRHDACVTIPQHFDKEKHKNFQFKKLDGGQYALYQFYDTQEKLNGAYKYLYEQWLPNSDYKADYDRYNLEFSMNNPAEDPDGKCKVHLYVPIKKRISSTKLHQKNNEVPKLLYDGSSIDVLYDYHEDAIKWYEKNLGWKVDQKEDWIADPRASQGKMTHMGRGTWLVSYITKQRLPFHYADRGTVDPNIRFCIKAKKLNKTHSIFSEKGIRVSDIYDGPGGHKYFDAWVTAEGTRFTFQDEIGNSPVAFPDCNNFRDTCVRIGVGDLEKSVEWYKEYVGMEVESEHINDGFVIMSLGVNHHPEGKSKWILEKLPENTYIGKVDGTVRPMCFIHNRDEFFEYHRFLKESGIEVGEIGGFTERGMSMFHFYDIDGNRFNVSSFV